ncbi:hypothetical protein B0H13DRAFT_1870493 [Mycena leptocephala]|nr:hypothetical protein B0H13DRAFT_1870493 [Mycena leptocephala]
MAPKSKDLPPAIRPATRAKNKDVHPAFDTGHRKPWGTRRTSTQIAEAQEKEDSAKRQAIAEQKRLTDKVAEIEDHQREEDLRYASQANHPVDAIVLNAVDERGEEPEEEEQGEDDGGDSERDPSFGEEDANVYTGSDSDDSDDDEESSAPRGRPKKTKTRRDDISAQCRTIAQSGTPKITNLKRKASPKQKAVKKTKKSKKSCLAPVPRRGTSSASGRSSRMAVDTDSEDDNDSMDTRSRNSIPLRRFDTISDAIISDGTVSALSGLAEYDHARQYLLVLRRDFSARPRVYAVSSDLNVNIICSSSTSVSAPRVVAASLDTLPILSVRSDPTADGTSYTPVVVTRMQCTQPRQGGTLDYGHAATAQP